MPTAGSSSSSGHLHYHRSIVPEPFQLIVLPLSGGEDVHDDRPVIQYNPSSSGGAFDAQGLYILSLEALDELLSNGSSLPLDVSCTDDEVVGQKGDVTDIKYDDIQSLSFSDGIYSRPC